MLDLATATEFFRTRYGAAAQWNAATAEDKTALLVTAEADVVAELGAELDYSMPAAVGAVCEQALHILTDPDALRDVSRITAESVEGVGSRSYRSGGMCALCARAERYVNQLRGACAGTVRISRG